MINFTNAVRKNKTFNGASGNKLSIIYNNEQYMLKFAPIAKKNKNMSYSNSTISEYIGSNIYKLFYKTGNNYSRFCFIKKYND